MLVDQGDSRPGLGQGLAAEPGVAHGQGEVLLRRDARLIANPVFQGDAPAGGPGLQDLLAFGQ